MSERGIQFNDDPGNGDRDPQPKRYPLDQEELSAIAPIAGLIRARTTSMPPSDLRSAAAVLLALERLPYATPGVHVGFTFTQPNQDGNYGWVNGEITEDVIRLWLGEHYYSAAVGGDTEHRVVFETHAGSDTLEGGIEYWLEVALGIEQEARLTFADNSDIHWETFL